MNDNLERQLADSRPTRAPNARWVADMQTKLAAPPARGGAGSPWGFVLAPVFAVLFTGLILSLLNPGAPAPRPMPLTGPDWETPVTAAEILPWTIVTTKPLSLAEGAAAFARGPSRVEWE